MRKFLAPIDGSVVAKHAVARAVEMAQSAGDTTLVLLNVQETLERWYTHGLLNKEALAHLEEQGREAAAEARTLLDESGVDDDFLIVYGKPAEVISRVAREQSCIGIVMGTRGLGDLENILLGSTAYKVVHLADMPVTLVK